MKSQSTPTLSDDLKDCIAFHGHLCPGLVYGYLVAREAMALMDISRSGDEEVVAVCENDSCAVDALQVLLGTTAGKGNLMLKDYGKNAFTVMNRSTRKAWRFSRKTDYVYEGRDREEFDMLERALSDGSATEQQKWRQKLLKAMDLYQKPVGRVFDTVETAYEDPPYAELARSVPCARCGEMTMATKMRVNEKDEKRCIPCAEQAAG
jgi:formylmethanofuran dehydrogenase subunit E